MLRSSPRNQTNKNHTNKQTSLSSSTTDCFETGLLGGSTTSLGCGTSSMTPTSSSLLSVSSMKRPTRSPASSSNHTTGNFVRKLSSPRGSPASPSLNLSPRGNHHASVTPSPCRYWVRCVRVGLFVLVMVYISSINHRFYGYSSGNTTKEESTENLNTRQPPPPPSIPGTTIRVFNENVKNNKNNNKVPNGKTRQKSTGAVPADLHQSITTQSTAPTKTITKTSSIESYNPLHHPILSSITTPSKEHPVPVWLFVGGAQLNKETNRPIFQPQTVTLFDGLKRSQYLNLQHVKFVTQQTLKQIHPQDQIQVNTNGDIPQLWMVDVASLNQDCHALERILQYAKFGNSGTSKGDAVTPPSSSIPPLLPSNWYLVLIDFTGTSTVLECPRLQTIHHFPKQQIRYVKRNIVSGRYWDSTKQWIEPGTVMLPNQGNALFGGPILHLPFMVRESVVASIRNHTMSRDDDSTTSTSLENNIHFKPMKNPASSSKFKRNMDVSLFVKQGDYTHYAFLRRRVASVIASLQGKKTETGRKVHTNIEYIREEDSKKNQNNVDVNQISPLYIQGLLTSKIVVVAQRDEWEDTYQLMEALCSGALVFVDDMISLPQGLHNATNIVIYDSAKSLEDLLMYYLDPKQDEERGVMARAGFKLVMGQHRSYHGLEEIVFGVPLTLVDKPYLPAPPQQLQLGDGSIPLTTTIARTNTTRTATAINMTTARTETAVAEMKRKRN